MYIDFSDYPINGIYYAGSERKEGITIYNDNYIMKYRKNTPFGKRYNHISEYLGSHIFELLGFYVQKTYLGYYNDEEVVLCKDFNADDVQFVPFEDVGESSLDVVNKELYQYSYKDIMELLEKNKKLTNIKEVVSLFFEMYIVDALIGNFDRHGANWGFLKKDNTYSFAPIFDNGSSLFPQMIDENDMKKIISSEDEINKRVYDFPLSQIKIDNKKSSYFDVISSLKFDECNKALIKIYNKIDLNKINLIIDELEISNIHKDFYKTILKARYEKILKYSYDKLMEKNHEECNN